MKNFLVDVCEIYDGLEFHFKYVMVAKNRKDIETLSNEKLSYYGHGESDVSIEEIVELTDSEYRTLKILGF